MNPCINCKAKKHGCYCDKFSDWVHGDFVQPILPANRKKMDKFNQFPKMESEE